MWIFLIIGSDSDSSTSESSDVHSEGSMSKDDSNEAEDLTAILGEDPTKEKTYGPEIS